VTLLPKIFVRSFENVGPDNRVIWRRA